MTTADLSLLEVLSDKRTDFFDDAPHVDVVFSEKGDSELERLEHFTQEGIYRIKTKRLGLPDSPVYSTVIFDVDVECRAIANGRHPAGNREESWVAGTRTSTDLREALQLHYNVLEYQKNNVPPHPKGCGL